MNTFGLNGDEWTAISSIGTAASAIFSGAGLIFVGLQIRAARKATDIQSLQAFMQGITDREKRLNEAQEGDDKDEAFFEFANYLELQAAAIHGGLYGGVTRGIVSDKINDSLAVIEMLEIWQQKFRAAVSTQTTFEHLHRFIYENRFAISKAKERMQAAT